MNMQEVLEKLLEQEVYNSEGYYDDALLLAPIIETALDAVIDKMVECYGFTGEMPKEIRDRWHARFVAAMVEES